MRERHPKKSGQAIIELLVAMSILIIGFLAAVRLLTQSFGITRVIEDSYKGTYLAVEGIEIVKNLVAFNINSGALITDGLADDCYHMNYETNLTPRDPVINPDTPQPTASRNPKTNPPLSFDESTKLYGYGAGTPTSFWRLICVKADDDAGVPYRIAVSSTVVWQTRGGGEFSATLEDYFYARP